MAEQMSRGEATTNHFTAWTTERRLQHRSLVKSQHQSIVTTAFTVLHIT